MNVNQRSIVFIDCGYRCFDFNIFVNMERMITNLYLNIRTLSRDCGNDSRGMASPDSNAFENLLIKHNDDVDWRLVTTWE